MPLAKTPHTWDKPKGQDKFLIRCNEKGIHPEDIVPLFKKKFDFERSYDSLLKRMSYLKISYANAVPKRKKVLTEKSAKKQVVEDVKLIQVQQKLRDITIKYNAIIQEESLGGRLIRVLKSEASALPKVHLEWRAPVKKITKETAVLLLGDFHCGEIVDKEAVCGFGEYNFDIFVRRLKFLAESIKSITIKKLKGYQIKKLVVLGMGDMVSGRIHEELIENAEDVIFQIMNGAYVTAQFILELRQLFPKIEIVGVLGNHGRLTKRVYYKKRYTNWDFVFYQFLSVFLANNADIKCSFPKSFFLVKKVYDWNFLVLHGDSIRSWMRIPWYGIERTAERLGDLLQGKGINIHYRIFGHFHNTGELDRVPGELIINGSVIGGTEFSLMSMSMFDRPTQLFFGVHKEIGMTWRYPLRLDLKEVDEVEPYKYATDLDAGKYMKELLEKK